MLWVLLGIVCLGVVGLAIYRNALESPFQFDDYDYIVDNPSVQAPDFIKMIRQRWMLQKRFVVFLTFALQYRFHGLKPFGFHVVNVAIHLINALLVWWMITFFVRTPRMASETSQWPKSQRLLPFTVALLFLAHPIQTQAVTYISQRFTVLAAFFYLLACCCYLQARGIIHKNGFDGKVLLSLIIAALSAGLGMFTKETVFTLPAAIVLIEWSFFPGEKRKRIFIFSLILLAFLLVVPFLYRLDFSTIFGYLKDEGITSRRYLLTQFGVIVQYLRLLFVPLGQSAEYDIPLEESFWQWSSGGNFLFLLAIFVAGLLAYRRARLVGFGILWFFLTLSVESSFLPIRDLMAEQRLYLPSVGFFLVMGFSMMVALPRIKTFLPVAVILIIMLGMLTWQRNIVWQSPFRLWEEVIRQFPNDARAYHNLGYHYFSAGNDGAALKYFNRALELNPNHFLALNNRGMIYRKKGHYNKAIQDYTIAIAIRPNFHKVYLNRANIYRQIRQYDRALADYSRAIELRPEYALAYFNRGKLYEDLQRYKDALRDYDDALSLKPDWADVYNNRGVVYIESGQVAKSIPEFEKAIALRPDWLDPYNNLGTAFSDLGRDEEARRCYENVIAIDHRHIAAQHNLGKLFFKLGQYDKAIEQFNTVLSIDPILEAYAMRGSAFLELGQYDLAISDYNQIIEQFPIAETFWMRSRAYYQKADRPQAIDDARRALGLGWRPYDRPEDRYTPLIMPLLSEEK
ncbi:MAG TPA: tetratricopeptide repeat protein [Candidatus Bathyarchaeia archaeon]|nr:tetratricopeptide repeat protein [Candidatus Bathyarchaeia archaeon]